MMTRRAFWIAFFGFILFLAGCGAKSQEDVVRDLEEKAKTMKGYKLEARMTLAMGSEPHEYEIEVWHNKPGYYRVFMKNAKPEQSQMILKNDEGVYVLTPALKKSFKFQSDWPDNTGQPYLYESLVKDILEDKNAKFKTTDDHYIFETKTRYHYQKMLPIQKVTFDRKSLAPVQVQVMDPDRNVMLAVKFSKTTFDAPFDEGSFDLDRNMTGVQLEIPALSESKSEDFVVKIPMAELPGTQLVEEKEVKTDNGTRIVMTFDGEKSFTFMQEKVEVLETAGLSSTFVNGDPVDLGFAVGALTDHSLTWTVGDVEYMIASNDLTKEEMVMLARSIQSETGK